MRQYFDSMSGLYGYEETMQERHIRYARENAVKIESLLGECEHNEDLSEETRKNLQDVRNTFKNIIEDERNDD